MLDLIGVFLLLIGNRWNEPSVFARGGSEPACNSIGGLRCHILNYSITSVLAGMLGVVEGASGSAV